MLVKLTIKPSTILVGYEEELNKLVTYTTNGNPAIVYGNYGVGKTSALLYLYKTLKANFKPIYISADLIVTLDDFRKAIENQLNFIGRLFKREFPKNAILLIDEADKLPDDVIYFVKEAFDSGKIHSFVLAAINKEAFPESVKHRIGEREVKLTGIKEEFVEEFFRVRVGEEITKYFEREALYRIWEIAEGNPRKMLELTERALVNVKERPIKVEHLEMFETKEKEETAKEEIPLSPMQKKILSLLEEGPKTLKEIAEILGISVHSAGARISELKRLGLIEEISTRPKKYKLKGIKLH